MNIDSLIETARVNDCVIYITPKRADGTPIVALVIAGQSMIDEVEQLVRPLTAEGEDGPDASVYLAAPELFAACEELIRCHDTDSPYTMDFDRAWFAAREALTKARGEEVQS